MAVRKVNVIYKPRKRKAKKVTAAAKPKRKTTARKTAAKKKPITAMVTPALKKKAKKEGGIAVKVVRTQTGGSMRAADASLKAKPPGWRLSRTGRLYYESRKNRSDKRGAKT